MFKKAMIAGAVALVSVGSYAASANMTVGGTITPEACAITLGNSGSVTYGNLSSAAVKAYSVVGATYAAPAQTISLDVNCTTPTAVALNWTDNRASSKLTVGSADEVRFGLGVSGTSNIGAYAIQYVGTNGLKIATTSSGTLATPAGYLTRAKNTTGAWSAPTSNSAAYFNPANALGFQVASSDTSPPAISKISGTLSVQSLFNKTLVDSATSVITIDGSATVAVEYI